MSPEHVIYLVLVSFSAFSLGTLGVASWLHLRMAGLWSMNFWRGILKVGCMLIIGTILWLVLPTRYVAHSPAVWIYLTGLFLAGIGSLGVCFKSIRVFVALAEDRDHPGGTS